MPVVGAISSRIAARYMVAFGWLALAGGMYYTVRHLDLLISFDEAIWLRIVQAVGLPFIFVPLSVVAYVGIAPEKSNSVSGLLNFMRNIGSSVGTSIVTTLVAQRAQAHQVTLTAHATTFNPSFREAVGGLTRRIDPGGGALAARARAVASVYHEIAAQAGILAYVDTFSILAAVAAVMFLMAFALKKNPVGGGSRLAMD